MRAIVPVLNSASGYDLYASEYDKTERYLNSFEKGEVIPMLGNVVNKNILDVGAGTGRIALNLASRGAAVTALDVSEQMLAILKSKNKSIVTVAADATRMPLPDESFDIVIATFLVVHLDRLMPFFEEAYRVLAPGGKFILTNINQRKPPELKTAQGKIKIKSFYHRPEDVIAELKNVFFTIEREKLITEKGTWVNQIILCRR